MPLMLRGAALLALVLVLVLMPVSASADLPPPEGFEFVPYGFQVDGLARFPDHIVVAFPWRAPSSGGELSPDHMTLEDAKAVRIGRRSPIPELYAVKRAAFEEFAKTYKPVPAGEAGTSTEGFLRKWVKCDAVPTVTNLKKIDDPRSEIIEKFRAERIDDKACHLVAVDAPNAATSASGGRAEPRRDNEAGAKPKDPGSRATADSGDNGIAESRGSGCAGCAMGGGAARPALGALALLAGLMAARRKRSGQCGQGTGSSNAFWGTLDIVSSDTTSLFVKSSDGVTAGPSTPIDGDFLVHRCGSPPAAPPTSARYL